jgi:hypothetical protein
LGPEAEVGASGSRSILVQDGEESPNTTRQGASRVHLRCSKRGSRGQHPAGTESITENIHPDFFDKKKPRKGEKVV